MTLQPPASILTSRSIRLEAEPQMVAMSEWPLLTASAADEHTLFRGKTVPPMLTLSLSLNQKTLKIPSDIRPMP